MIYKHRDLILSANCKLGELFTPNWKMKASVARTDEKGHFPNRGIVRKHLQTHLNPTRVRVSCSVERSSTSDWKWWYGDLGLNRKGRERRFYFPLKCFSCAQMCKFRSFLNTMDCVQFLYLLYCITSTVFIL